MVIPGGGLNVLGLALVHQCRATVPTGGDTSRVAIRGCADERPIPADPAVVGLPSTRQP
jgi:hypothetical protein